MPVVLRFSADWRTPVVRSASAEYSRPFSGRPRVCSPVITCPRWLESVSTSGAAAVTWTFSVSCPTVMVRSTRGREPTCTCTLSTSATAKPLFSAVITYVPGFTVKNSYWPAAPVVFTFETPVSRLVSVTVASGITAPELSRTVPTTDAVSNCAEADTEKMTRKSAPSVNRFRIPMPLSRTKGRPVGRSGLVESKWRF